MFPIAWMYYFGVNLENRFAVPDFWPKPEETYKIPFEKQDIAGELERLRQRRLEKRAKRLDEGRGEGIEEKTGAGMIRMEGQREETVATQRPLQEQKQSQNQGQGKSWWKGLW